jgi:hypothetical protein
MGQFHEVVSRMRHHFWMTTVFYETQFTTSSMTPALAAAAAITLLFITSAGWKQADRFLKNIFVLATASATFCAAIPGIYQQQENMDANKKLYLQYAALANEICSYAATGDNQGSPQAQSRSAAKKKDPAAFIH